MNISLPTSLIAPCGMNCGLCLAYQRVKNHCEGCITTGANKTNHCPKCSIRNCEMLTKSKSKYCYKCQECPCSKIKHIDKRYRNKYGMSMIENLNTIKEIGIRKFVELEKQKRACSKCGSIICVHKEVCLVCGAKRIYNDYSTN
jgi:hypothetical protein